MIKMLRTSPFLWLFLAGEGLWRACPRCRGETKEYVDAKFGCSSVRFGSVKRAVLDIFYSRFFLNIRVWKKNVFYFNSKEKRES